MVTYEDVTECFVNAAKSAGLATHPEYWTNTRSLEREFACTCHTGSCDESDTGSTCTLSFTWSTLDTALSLEGPKGICEFFHDPEREDHCPHLHTHEIPPLMLELSYSLTLNGRTMSESELLALVQRLKLHASEHSSRAIETRPGLALTLQDNRLQAEVLTLQQRVEVPIWHPSGMRGLLDPYVSEIPGNMPGLRQFHVTDEGEVLADAPHPEEWLPQVMIDVCQDIMEVMKALDAARVHGSLQ